MGVLKIWQGFQQQANSPEITVNDRLHFRQSIFAVKSGALLTFQLERCDGRLDNRAIRYNCSKLREWVDGVSWQRLYQDVDCLTLAEPTRVCLQFGHVAIPSAFSPMAARWYATKIAALSAKSAGQYVDTRKSCVQPLVNSKYMPKF
jgi:hypothetical protein